MNLNTIIKMNTTKSKIIRIRIYALKKLDIDIFGHDYIT